MAEGVRNWVAGLGLPGLQNRPQAPANAPAPLPNFLMGRDGYQPAANRPQPAPAPAPAPQYAPGYAPAQNQPAPLPNLPLGPAPQGNDPLAAMRREIEAAMGGPQGAPLPALPPLQPIQQQPSQQQPIQPQPIPGFMPGMGQQPAPIAPMPAPAPMPPQNQGSEAPAFEAVDTNHDEKITFEELLVATGNNVDMAAQFYVRADRGNNGTIDRQEWSMATGQPMSNQRPMPAPQPAPAPTPYNPGGNLQPVPLAPAPAPAPQGQQQIQLRSPESFARLDTNRDQQLDFNELMAGIGVDGAAVVINQDRNGDAKISAQEWALLR